MHFNCWCWVWANLSRYPRWSCWCSLFPLVWREWKVCLKFIWLSTITLQNTWLFSIKGTFLLCSFKNYFDFKWYNPTLLCSNSWNLLINTKISLDEIILICNSFVVLFFLAVLMSSLVLSGWNVDTIFQRYSLSGNSFSFIFAKYELRSSISCTRGHIFAILGSLYFRTTMYFTSQVLNAYRIYEIIFFDVPFSSL